MEQKQLYGKHQTKKKNTIFRKIEISRLVKIYTINKQEIWKDLLLFQSADAYQSSDWLLNPGGGTVYRSNISNNDSACHPCGHHVCHPCAHRACRLCGRLFCHRGDPYHGHSGMADTEDIHGVCGPGRKGQKYQAWENLLFV